VTRRPDNRLVLLILAMLCWMPSPAAAESLPGPTFEPITLKTPAGGSISAEIGRLRVPESRAMPGSRTVDLAFVRIKGTKNGPAHVLLAGGPGAPGIDLVKDLAARGGPPLLALFGGDIIGIDQRGTGLSRPSLATDARYHTPPAEPGDRVRDLARISAVCSAVAADFRARGIDLASYNTVESADDIDAVRRAVGYEKIVLWGRSYGSHLALATLKRHEAAIDRLILCSPEGPDHTLKRPRDVQGALERLTARVRTDPVIGPRVPDLLGLMRTVLDRLERQPVSVDIAHPATRTRVTVGISAFDLQRLTAQSLGSVERMQPLPAAYVKMAGGDFEDIARVLLVAREREGVGSAMKFMMDCSSGASPERLQLVAREAPECLLGDALNFPYPDIRAAWGNPDLGDAFRAPVRSTVPVLLFCGDLDARTPPANARELLTGLSNGQLVILENGGHDFNLFGNAELRGILVRFLSGKPPRSLPSMVALPALRFPVP
jgi:pimeloyl-ACP methyl ester carboxylesterase